MKKQYLFLVFSLLFWHFTLSKVSGQGVLDIISKAPSYASCNYHIYPDSIEAILYIPLWQAWFALHQQSQRV